MTFRLSNKSNEILQLIRSLTASKETQKVNIKGSDQLIDRSNKKYGKIRLNSSDKNFEIEKPKTKTKYALLKQIRIAKTKYRRMSKRISNAASELKEINDGLEAVKEKPQIKFDVNLLTKNTSGHQLAVSDQLTKLPNQENSKSKLSDSKNEIPKPKKKCDKLKNSHNQTVENIEAQSKIKLGLDQILKDFGTRQPNSQW